MKKVSVLIMACSMALAARAQLIDDFNSPGIGEYLLTRVLDNGVAEANVSFSDLSGSLMASYAGTVNQPEQVVFLRSDFSLPVGSALLVDVLFPVQTSQMDFGIAVSATATPAGVVNPTPTDTRGTFDWAAIYVRPSQDAVRNTSSINGTVVTGTGVAAALETSVGQLYIERTASTMFTLGYIDTSAIRHDTRSIVFTAGGVGTALGFYGDLRAAGGFLGNLDNLRIEVIPEPSTLALLGAGGLAMLLRRRGRRSI